MAKGGKSWIAVLIVALLVAALAYRLWPRGSSTPAPPDAAAVPADAAIARADAQVIEHDVAAVTPEVDTGFHPGEWELQAISTAGDKVLLYRPAKAPGDIPAYRVVVIATGISEADVELTSMKFIGVDDPGVPLTDTEQITAELADYQKVWPLLREFPLGAGDGAAATPDGKHGAFNNGDHLYVVGADKPIKVALPAAYDPMILADGKTVLMRGYDGEYDGPGTGRYAMFTMPITGGKLTKVAGSAGTVGNWALSGDGKFLRTVVGEPPRNQACVVEIPLVMPLQLGKKRCIDGDGAVQLSPHGDRFLWSVELDAEADSTIGRGRPVRQRLRAMEIDRGSVPFDHMTGGTFRIADRGRILIEDAETIYDVDGKTTREIEIDRVTLYCRFLDDTAVVCPHGDSVKRIDLAALPAAR